MKSIDNQTFENIRLYSFYVF